MSDSKQTVYIFIPGKNWKLSLAELISYLNARKCKSKISNISESFLAVETEKILDPSLIDNLGGTIKIGKVILQVSSETVQEAFLRRSKQAQIEIKTNLRTDYVINEIFKTPREKCVFGVSIYFENPRLLRVAREMQRFVGSCFKEELAAHGIRAKFMGFPKSRILPQLTHVEVLKKGLIEKSAEILLCIGKEQAFIANTVAVHNPFEFQKRDINRPVQRKIFSIPPRLAKIMVNLSSCTSGKVLLDPFCGAGTILQEAMLAEAQVIGMDINPWCVKASCTNLEWLKKEYNLGETRHKVLLGDARHLTDRINEESIDCVVTEPDLGPALRHLPTGLHAKRIADKLRPLFCDFMEEASRTLKDGGKLVLVTPYIKTRSSSFVSLDIKEETERIGFKIVYSFERGNFVNDTPLIEDLTRTSSFIDMEQRHKVGREIHIFQK